jgi:hypothetical protein
MLQSKLCSMAIAHRAISKESESFAEMHDDGKEENQKQSNHRNPAVGDPICKQHQYQECRGRTLAKLHPPVSGSCKPTDSAASHDFSCSVPENVQPTKGEVA